MKSPIPPAISNTEEKSNETSDTVMEKGAQDDQGVEGRMDEKLHAPHVNPENPGATHCNRIVGHRIGQRFCDQFLTNSNLVVLYAPNNL